MTGNFLLKKIVDRSALDKGFAIPVDKHAALSCHLSGGALAHGEKRMIKIFLRGEIFDVKLSSSGFDRRKYPTHSEQWQILYPAAVAAKIREIFSLSQELMFYPADMKDAFVLEPNFAADELTLERILELSTLTDSDAAIVARYHLERYRRLNREIGERLKRTYKYRCQICGLNVGKIYGEHLAECHHIAPFSQSLDNDASNLLIVCPNHHRIIHLAAPTFDRERKLYRYPNGRKEFLLLNEHL